MQLIAGAILILAGAVLFAAGVVANAIRPNDAPTGCAFLGGVVLGVMGLVMISQAFREIYLGRRDKGEEGQTPPS